MRTFLTTFLFLFLLSACQNDIQPKGTIQGIVKNAQKNPIEGANVTIFYLDELHEKDVSQSIVTTIDGKFSFPELNYCTFRLEVSKTGYETSKKAFALTEKEFYNTIILIP